MSEAATRKFCTNCHEGHYTEKNRCPDCDELFPRYPHLTYDD